MSFSEKKEVILALCVPIVLAILGFYYDIFISKAPNIMIHNKDLNKIEIINNGQGVSKVEKALFYLDDNVFCLNGRAIDELAGMDYLKYDAESKDKYSLIPPGGIVEIASCKRCREDDADQILDNIDIFIEYKGKGMFNERKYFCSNKNTCNLNKLLNFNESC